LRYTLPNGVIIVDKDGVSYPEGWNPNLILNLDQSTYGYRLTYQEVIGKEFFQHPEYPWVTAYKNVWSNPTAEIPSGGLDGKPQPIITKNLNFDQFFGKQNKKVMDRHLNKTQFHVGYKYLLEDPSEDWRGVDGYMRWLLLQRGQTPPPTRESLFKPTFKDDLSKSIVITSAEGQRVMKDVKWIEETSKFLTSMRDENRAERLRERLKLKQLKMEKNGVILTVL